MAVLALCALPASASTASTSAAHAATHNFTVPTIKHHNVVTAWGKYTKINSARVRVQICVKQTGPAFAVGAIAVVSKANGSSKNIAAVIIQGHRGSEACGVMTFIFYTAHLKVHTFIGQGGKIIATGAVKKIY
ncbi:MAG: hypothetical protein JO345_35230 [Streptosporangiaceae bacterium]|nr:hypothetical protein [Streptosporangiaceae bacterium]